MHAINIIVLLTLFTRSSLLTHLSQLLLSCFGHLLLGGLRGPARLGQLESVHVPGEARDLEITIVIWIYGSDKSLRNGNVPSFIAIVICLFVCLDQTFILRALKQAFLESSLSIPRVF